MGGNRNIPVLRVKAANPTVQEGWYTGGGVLVQSPLLTRLLLELFLPKQEKRKFYISPVNWNLTVAGTLPSRLRPQARASEQPRVAQLLASRSERLTITAAPGTQWPRALWDKKAPPFGGAFAF